MSELESSYPLAELPAGRSELDEDTLAALALDRRDREDRSSYLPHEGHDIVAARVVRTDPSPGRSGSAPPPWDEG